MIITSDMLYELKEDMANGLGPVEVAAKLGISLKYFKKLIRENVELQEAYEIGRTAYEAFFLGVGKNLMLGEYPRGKDAAWNKFMENEFGWSSKSSVTVDDPLKNKTDEELNAEIKRLQNKIDDKSE